MNTPATGTPETKGPGAEAPGPFNQGAPAASRKTPDAIVADQERRRKAIATRPYIEGEPAPGRVMEDGRVVAGWHRTNTSASGQRRGPGSWYTDVAVDYTDGSTDYAIVVTRNPL